MTATGSSEWPTATIRAVEANPANFQLLDQNVEHNHEGPGVTQTLWAAVWDGSTEHAFTAGHGGLAGTSSTEPEDADEVEQVEAVSLDALLADLGHVDVLKIDTEGAEVPIVMGASPETLAKVGYVTGEFHGMVPEWGAWARKLAAFFDLTLRAHPYPDHVWGGMFCGAAR
jgi:FkbM family methyltransferase